MPKPDPEQAKWAQIALSLRILQQYPEWGAFAAEIDRVEANLLAGIVNADLDTFELAKGRWQGLQAVRQILARSS